MDDLKAIFENAEMVNIYEGINILANYPSLHNFGKAFLNRFPMESRTPKGYEIAEWSQKEGFFLAPEEARNVLVCLQVAKAYKSGRSVENV